MNKSVMCLCMPSSLHKASACARFGNDLVQAAPPFRNNHGTFANVNASLSCSGNATKWNLCFYGSTTDTNSVTYLGIYRLLSGTTYSLIPGSLTSHTYTVQRTFTYTCSSLAIPQSQQYIVNPGDVLMACVPRFNFGRLGIIGVTTGASVLRNSVTCSSLPTDPVDVNPSGGFFTQVTDEIVHFNLGRMISHCFTDNRMQNLMFNYF